MQGNIFSRLLNFSTVLQFKFHWIFALGCFLVMALICFLPALPTVDLPQHAAVTAVLANPNDPIFQEHYRSDWSSSPYVLYYAVAVLLAKITGSAAFAVHFLEAICFALFIGSLIRIKNLIKVSWYLIACGPVVYFNSIFYWGFAPFHLSCVLSFFILPYLANPTHAFWDSIKVFAIVVLAGAFHAFGLILAAVFLGSHVAFETSSLFRSEFKSELGSEFKSELKSKYDFKRALKSILFSCRSLFPLFFALCAVYVWSNTNSFKNNDSGFSLQVFRDQWTWALFSHKSLDFLRVVFEGPKDRWNQWLSLSVGLIACFLFFLTFLAVFLRKSISFLLNLSFEIKHKDSDLFLFFATSCAMLSMIVLYLLLPIHLGLVYHINLRAGVALFWILPFWLMTLWSILKKESDTLEKSFPRKALFFEKGKVFGNHALETLTWAIGFSSLAFVCRDLLWFNQENAPLQKITERISAGSSYVYTGHDIRGEHFELPVFLQQGSYIQAQKGGFSGVSFAWMFPHIPIRIREEKKHPQIPPWNTHSYPGLLFSAAADKDYPYIVYRGTREQLNRTQGFSETNFQVEDFGSGYFLLERRQR